MTSSEIIQCNYSSSHVIRTYDVFVSFRGEDTRNNFTGFLFQALRKKGIDAFRDDADLKKGESIAPELLQAILGSRIFVVVFSKNYASSTWCLRELAEICNCVETSPRRVLPIFYDVDPSEVRKQSGCYENAFAEHIERFGEDKEKMEQVTRWRESLTHVANLSGWDIRDKPQYAEIEQIVQTIINITGHKFSSLPNDNLVGIGSRVEELAKFLHLGSVNDIRVVGISGMGGIGKTTLARALYERISGQYDFHCFIDDVRKIYQESSTLGVQKQLLCQSLNENSIEICNVSEGTCLVWNRLRDARALIVLDNVDKIEQLKMFAGSRETLLRECLAEGSRIIIISRDEHILRAHGVDDIYQVHPLNAKDALQLFCKNAFKSNIIANGFEKLSDNVLLHTQGHPLAIEVLGSSLFGRNVSQWTSALARLKVNKSKRIMDVLRISFDGLEDTEKEIFLDIACFFMGNSMHYVEEFLNFRGFNAEYGLQVLIDKSLIIHQHGLLLMHGLLVDLGRYIVQEKSPKEPRKWSRLWDYQHLDKVMSLSDNMAAENLEGIVITSYKTKHEIGETTIRVDALSKMTQLKLLQFHFVDMKFSGSLNHLSNELGYLSWENYPFECLPSSFQPNKLVTLYLPHSNIKQLWEGLKPLHNLRRLNLSFSKNLIEMPDLSEAINLEYVTLDGCIKLKQIHPSIGLLKKLISVRLGYCKSLIKLPHFIEAQNLETLYLYGCIKLRKIDPSVGLLRKLTSLDLKDCRSLTKLPHFTEDLCLTDLNLKGCIQLMEINPSIGRLRKLTYLNLQDCRNLRSLPSSLLCLSSLTKLNLSGCSKLYNIQFLDEPSDEDCLRKVCIGEAPFPSHSTLSIMKRKFQRSLHLLYSRARKDSVSCLLPSISTFPCMRELHLDSCNLVQIPDAIGNLRCLEWLTLTRNNFATLPSLKELSKLRHLDLKHCKQLKYLTELPARTDLSSEPLQIPYPKIISQHLQILLVFPFGDYHPFLIREGLVIFNCPKLVERERCTNMGFSWMIQILQAHCKYQHLWRYYYWPPVISSIIPGSCEIPRWFHNQHVGMGNSIRIDTACGDDSDNDFSGVMCAVVLTAHSRRGTVSPMRQPRLHKSIHPPVGHSQDPVKDKSDHMLLFYFNSEQYSDDILDISTVLRLDILDMQDFQFEVKKFGYRWVRKRDLERIKIYNDR